MLCSFLIYRNLVLKFMICKEVASYMYVEIPMSHGSINENENVRYFFIFFEQTKMKT